MSKVKIPLHFKNELSINEVGKHVRDGLSAALRTGRNLWVACDERSSLERLTLSEDQSFTNHTSFDLTKFLDLPTGSECEIDVEGLAQEGHYLWLIGSHSLARKKPKKGDSTEKQISSLAKVNKDPNRYLLARIPFIKDIKTGQYELHKSCPNPDEPSKTLTTGQLVKKKKGNQLMKVLKDDEHYKNFISIPGKDNGFDIEGLAVSGNRIFIGIRGPVLRGWASILEVVLKETGHSRLKIKPDKKGNFYKKHFLKLGGMGIRELRVVEDDLLILAGPTMDLDGTIAVYRWPKGVVQRKEAIVHRKDLIRLFDVPHGHGKTSGQDKAEGMALYSDNELLIVFDSPTEDRKIGEDTVIADLYSLK